MDYSTNYFGIKLDDLQYQDLVNFFSAAQVESDRIEFKSYSTRGNFENQFQNIFKACCAFLNSEGGILIWGAPVGQVPAGQTEEVFHGALQPINQVLEKDRLINKVTDNITPAPNSIRVKILNDNQDYICVFEIQPSDYRPHQYNNRYYIRLDGQSRPAPHYLIEAFFRQIRFPNVEGFLKLLSFGTNPRGAGYVLKVDFAFFNFSPLENEFDPSLRALISKGRFHGTNSGELRLQNLKDVLYYGESLLEHQTIYFDPNDFNDDYEVDLVMSFGGKKGPMKVSNYKLDLSDLNPNHLNDLIIDRKENITLKELQDSKGTTRESILKTFLER